RRSSRSALEPAALQQRLDVGIPAPEVAERLERVLRAADTEQAVPEPVAVGPRQPAVVLEPFDGVGVEYFAPDVRVVPGAVAAGEDVLEVRRGVAGGDG